MLLGISKDQKQREMSVFKKGHGVTRLKEILSAGSHSQYQNFSFFFVSLNDGFLLSYHCRLTENMTAVDIVALYLRASATESEADLFNSNSKILEKSTAWVK